MFKRLCLQNACPLEILWLKKKGVENVEEVIKKPNNFCIAQRCGLLQYVLGKIALVANTLCVHKLHKVSV